jgi:hypothetical protein
MIIYVYQYTTGGTFLGEKHPDEKAYSDTAYCIGTLEPLPLVMSPKPNEYRDTEK